MSNDDRQKQTTNGWTTDKGEIRYRLQAYEERLEGVEKEVSAMCKVVANLQGRLLVWVTVITLVLGAAVNAGTQWFVRHRAGAHDERVGTAIDRLVERQQQLLDRLEQDRRDRYKEARQ